MDANLTTEPELGLLIYDVPTVHARLAHLMRERLRRSSLRVNLSAYLFRWQDRGMVEGIVREVQEETGQFCSANIVPQSNDGKPVLLKMAADDAELYTKELYTNLIDRIGRIPALIEKAMSSGKLAAGDQTKEHVRRSRFILAETRRRLEHTETMALLLGIENAGSGSLKGWFETTKNLIKIEAEAVQRMKNSAKGQQTFIVKSEAI